MIVELNQVLFINIMFVFTVLSAISRVILGASGAKKETCYGGTEVIAGLISLGVAIVVLVL